MNITSWLSRKCRWSEVKWPSATSCSTSPVEFPYAKGTSKSRHLSDLHWKAVIAQSLKLLRGSFRYLLKISSYHKSSRSSQQSTMKSSRPLFFFSTWKNCVLIMGTYVSSGTSQKGLDSILGQKQTMNGSCNRNTQYRQIAKRPNPNSTLMNNSSLQSNNHQPGSRPYSKLKRRS